MGGLGKDKRRRKEAERERCTESYKNNRASVWKEGRKDECERGTESCVIRRAQSRCGMTCGSKY